MKIQVSSCVVCLYILLFMYCEIKKKCTAHFLTLNKLSLCQARSACNLHMIFNKQPLPNLNQYKSNSRKFISCKTDRRSNIVLDSTTNGNVSLLHVDCTVLYCNNCTAPYCTVLYCCTVLLYCTAVL
jgi:hypothetical protein